MFRNAPNTQQESVAVSMSICALYLEVRSHQEVCLRMSDLQPVNIIQQQETVMFVEIVCMFVGPTKSHLHFKL